MIEITGVFQILPLREENADYIGPEEESEETLKQPTGGRGV